MMRSAVNGSQTLWVVLANAAVKLAVVAGVTVLGALGDLSSSVVVAVYSAALGVATILGGTAIGRGLPRPPCPPQPQKGAPQ